MAKAHRTPALEDKNWSGRSGSLQSLVEIAGQVVEFDWLGQEANRSGIHSACPRGGDARKITGKWFGFLSVGNPY